LVWFKDRDTELFCDFLTRWPTLQAVQRARPATLERFFHAHRVRSAKLIQQRIEGINAATALTRDEAVIAPNALVFK
jgi:hypothetical protein